jgi:hypothetical protein
MIKVQAIMMLFKSWDSTEINYDFYQSMIKLHGYEYNDDFQVPRLYSEIGIK